MSLVSYVLKSKRLSSIKYLQKEYPHLSAPFIALSTGCLLARTHQPTASSIQPSPTQPPLTQSPMLIFKNRIRFKFKIDPYRQKELLKSEMDLQPIKSNVKITIKHGNPWPTTMVNRAIPGAVNAKSAKPHITTNILGSSALDFHSFYGIMKIRNLKASFIDQTALNMKDVKYL